MIIMNKYCETRWSHSRPAYTIRKQKYRRMEELKNTSTSVSADSNVDVNKEITK